MKNKEKILFVSLFLLHIYCLILSWFNGGYKIQDPLPFFFHFLTWWCVWNSILTLGFIFWKGVKKPSEKAYSTQVVSLILMISNVITFLIFSIGLLLWWSTILTTHWGITAKVHKLVPIPSHRGENFVLAKVIHWWAYAPLWHLGITTCFFYWFYRYAQKNQLKKKLRLTLLFSLIHPVLYFTYCKLRSKLSPSQWLISPFSRWPYSFLSSKEMARQWKIPRWTYKVSLVLFWFALVSLIAYYLILSYVKKRRNKIVSRRVENLKNQNIKIKS